MKNALEGVKVLDLTMNLPGPFMTWLMAQMGAEIIKVENPEIGDFARVYTETDQDAYLPIFNLVNRGKKSITLNLKIAEDRQRFLKLVKEYSIVVEGFRPRVVKGLGIDYQTVSRRYPEVIYVSITGYGQKGEYALRAGHDLNYQALAGSFDNGSTEVAPSGVPTVPVADLGGGGLMALAGLLAAIIERGNTGKGQHLDVSMFDGAFALNVLALSQMQRNRLRRSSEGHFLSGSQPFYRIYETKDGLPVSLGAVEPKFWQTFCRVAGCESLADCQFGGEDVIRQVADTIKTRTRAEWIEAFKDADACFEPVLSIPETIASDLCRTRGLVTTDDDGGVTLCSPIKAVGERVQAQAQPPALGQHNYLIFGQDQI